MNLGKALENLKYDNRMTDWNLSQGIITEKEVKDFEASLQDLSEKCKPLDLEGDRRPAASSLNGDGSHQH